MTKITIIGTGNVGSTIAYTLTVTGIANEIVMIDINKERALGEALDVPLLNWRIIFINDDHGRCSMKFMKNTGKIG